MEARGPSAAKLPSRYVSLTYFQNGSLRRWDLACVADFCLKGRGRRGRLCPASILSVSCYCCASPTYPVIAIEQWLPCPSGRATRQGVVIGTFLPSSGFASEPSLPTPRVTPISDSLVLLLPLPPSIVELLRLLGALLATVARRAPCFTRGSESG